MPHWALLVDMATSRRYRLFSRVDGGLGPISKGFRSHIESLGTELLAVRESAASRAGSSSSSSSGTAAAASAASVSPSLGPKASPVAAIAVASSAEMADMAFVAGLLELHDRTKHMVDSYFGGSTQFHKALRDAFESFVNRETKTKISNTEVIAQFCDRLLRGVDKLSDTEVEDTLERVVGVFAFIVDKDRFAEIYRNQLAKRLLNGRSASADAERSIISKLKLRCGAQYTSKLEGMLSDLQVVHEQLKDFREWASGPGETVLRAIDCEFSVQVLTTGWWPAFRSVPLAVPRILKDCQDAFGVYYSARTSNRRLAWCYSLGSATVSARFGSKSFELNVATLQAACLLLFNDYGDDRLVAVKEVSTALNTDDEITKRILHSLACGKSRVLSKHPPGKSISMTDQFSVNTAFASANKRVKIPMSSLEESHSVKKVDDDRRNAIDAAIVRTMKSAKRMTHSELFASVLRILQTFRPDPKVVKKRIEYCIDNDYIERDEADTTVYLYVA
jgi:cullin 1